MDFCVAQSVATPRISVMADTGAVVIRERGQIKSLLNTVTLPVNYNLSANMRDTAISIPIDSLQTDRTATIITVYETEEDNTIGLWEISNAGKSGLWLNSQVVSYEGIPVRYRKANEKGVIVHTVTCAYPETGSLYNGHDTLRLGVCDTLMGNKKLCALLYYNANLTPRQKRMWESALAIRFGASLHGPYINSGNDTLWSPLGIDSTYSHGVCGIGRDDTLSLYQPQSTIRGDLLTISAASPLQDMTHVMMGSDSNGTDLSPIPVIVGEEPFYEMQRHWKVRAHGLSPQRVTLHLDSSYKPSTYKVTVESVAGTQVLHPMDTVNLLENKEYIIGILMGSHDDTQASKHQQGDSSEPNEKESLVTMCTAVASPNPTTGDYSVTVKLQEKDYIHIRVTDANGRTIEEHHSAGEVNEYRYKSSLLSSGVYYISVNGNGIHQTIKLIVAH